MFFSYQLHSSTGSSQGCCVSTLLFILCTNECRRNHANRHIIQFKDDSIIFLKGGGIIMGLIVFDEFTSWWDDSVLEVNISKTKNIIITASCHSNHDKGCWYWAGEQLDAKWPLVEQLCILLHTLCGLLISVLCVFYVYVYLSWHWLQANLPVGTLGFWSGNSNSWIWSFFAVFWNDMRGG